MGERGKTRATKELRIKWLGHKQTTWELLSTLGADCPDVMREWTLRPTEAKQKLAEASDAEDQAGESISTMRSAYVSALSVCHNVRTRATQDKCQEARSDQA